MNKGYEILRELFTRDLRTSTIETAIFLAIVFGFFGILVLANILKRRNEQQRLAALHRDKWLQLSRRINLTNDEADLLEKAAHYLKIPEKKYLLLVDYQVFHNALSQLTQERPVDQNLIDSILRKSGMKEHAIRNPDFQIQRRKSLRHAVDILARVAPIEHTTAHVSARMLDLSTGGCKMENPDLRFHAGDDIKISFGIQGKEYVDIPAEVVRTGPGARTLHICFGHVKKKMTS